MKPRAAPLDGWRFFVEVETSPDPRRVALRVHAPLGAAKAKVAKETRRVALQWDAWFGSLLVLAVRVDPISPTWWDVELRGERIRAAPRLRRAISRRLTRSSEALLRYLGTSDASQRPPS